ncbi:hypothetical protein RCL1_005861 [Eukaryota sp. TZLM3-RCL]
MLFPVNNFQQKLSLYLTIFGTHFLFLCIETILMSLLLQKLGNPAALWQWFLNISAIPHGSYNCQPLSDYIAKVASEHGFEFAQDSALNVVVRKPASRSELSSVPSICFQAHIDMVCQTDGNVDFKATGIQPQLIGDKLHGFINGVPTTLGADNGMSNFFHL